MVGGRRCLQGFSETALSFAAHGGMNVTGLSIVDINNKTTKAFARAWKGLDSTKWTDSGHRQITASRLVWLPPFPVLFGLRAIRLSDPDQDSQRISVQIHLANRMT